MEESVRKNWEYACVCGHLLKDHRWCDPRISTDDKVICITHLSGPALCNWHHFKLDNLFLVEQLAKERNLI